MSNSTIQSNLSNLQLELLKLYASGVNDEELLEIKQLLSKYFLKKAVNEATKVANEKNYTPTDFDNWLNKE
ncbi:MAG: hypothetical protein H6553_06170 [Chitinophagales bacterium]|nr:hypothetical protein [Chitinophagales bacterium]